MSKQQAEIPPTNKKRQFEFKVRDKEVKFSGNFDSGNLQSVQQLTPYIYRITAGYDQPRHSSKKSIFHFRITGLAQCTITLLISRIDLLEPFITLDNHSNLYHPVFKTPSQPQYKKLKETIKLYYNMSSELEMSFNYSFGKEQETYFAFTYPYSYSDGQRFIKEMADKYQNHANIKFKNKILGTINNQFNVNVIKISSRNSVLTQQLNKSDRSSKFTSIRKPKILITARVHPGQSPSSFCAQGIIRYLLNEEDYRSYILRKHFEFVIVPMLNPEAVHNGYFRSDTNGYNLNRVYYCADQILHPSVWALKSYLEKMPRIDFYFDLHGHSGLKDFFIYGNAFKELDYQVEAQIFGKIIEHNCAYFQNLNCIFSESAMKSKDRYDKLTKQGCGRVFFHKTYNIVHSYTVQCGFFFASKLNNHPTRHRQPKTFQNKYTQTKDWQQISMGQYTPLSYMLLGKAILNSILDLFHLNPYTKMPKKTALYLDNLRMMTANKIFNEHERFQLNDEHILKKMKNQPSLIEKKYYEKRFGYCGLSIINKALPNFIITAHQTPFINSQRKVIAKLHSNTPQNLIKSQTLITQQPSNKQASILPPMKIPSTLSPEFKLIRPSSIQRKLQPPQTQTQPQQLMQQVVIGGVHEQIYKQFAVYSNKSKSKQQRNERKRVQTELITKKFTMNDFGLQKSFKMLHVQSSVNLNNIKKEVMLHILKRKKEAQSSTANFNFQKKNNFRIINGKQTLRDFSVKKGESVSQKRSLKTIKNKL